MKKDIVPVGYHRILKILYGNNLMEIISLLNTSIYVTDFDRETDSHVIHTGVSFFTQTGQEMEVLYDFSSKNKIIQPRNTKSGLSLPQLNGLTVKTGGDYNPEYFDVVFPMFLCEYLYNKNKEELYTVIAFDSSLIHPLWNKSDVNKLILKNPKDKSRKIISNIKVFIEKKSKYSRELFPLNITINQSIFLDPNGWIFKYNRDFGYEDFNDEEN